MLHKFVVSIAVVFSLIGCTNTAGPGGAGQSMANSCNMACPGGYAVQKTCMPHQRAVCECSPSPQAYCESY